MLFNFDLSTVNAKRERKTKRNLEKNSRKREERDVMAGLEGREGSCHSRQAKKGRSAPRLILLQELRELMMI